MSLSLSRRCLDVATRNARMRDLNWQRPPLMGLILTQCRYYAARPAVRTQTKAETNKMTSEERLERFEQMRVMAAQLGFDPWAQPIQTLDVHIPSYRSYKKNAGVLDHLSAVVKTIRNSFMNVLSMRRMAQYQGFPGVSVKHWFSWQILCAQSTKDHAWISSIRKNALETYKQVNGALANGDEKTIKRLSASDMQEHYLKLLRSQDKSRVYVWRFHGERSPCRIVSVRSIMANLDKPADDASPLLVQVLVKFDTMQSLDVYSKKGTLLHSQSEPKPVVEYLVLQRRMWYDSPWVIRDRLFEGVESQYEEAAE